MPLKQLNNSKFVDENKKVTLVIETSKVGALIPGEIKFNRVDWAEKFKFQMAANDKS